MHNNINHHKPFEEEELQLTVNRGNIYHNLNNDNLRKAAQVIFHDKVSKEYYQKTIVAGNYIGFDLEKHGFTNLLVHIRLLAEFFRSAIHLVGQTTRQKSNKVFFMGEGQGRTSIAAIEIAKQLQIKEIYFNDLLTEHVEHVREKVARCYGTRSQIIDGVKLQFVPGDFTEVAQNIDVQFDAIFAMWMVTSEICDFSNVDSLRDVRDNLYHSVKKLLTKQGVFVEEIPFSEGIGNFYYVARLKTYHILHEMGILEGENDHMLLTDFTDIQSSGFPYHIRYIPCNGKHRQELESVGLVENESTVTFAPSGIKNLGLYEKEIGSSEKIVNLFAGNSIDDIIPYLKQKEQECLLFPKTTDIVAEKKKTILWRQKYPI